MISVIFTDFYFPSIIQNNPVRRILLNKTSIHEQRFSDSQEFYICFPQIPFHFFQFSIK